MPDFFEEIIKRDSTTQIVGGGGASPTGTYFTIDNNLSEGTPSTMRTNLGLVIGTDVQAHSSELDTYVGNPLTAGELQQLQNINTVTISNTQWGYVGVLNQNLRTTDTVIFGKVESADDVVAYRSGSGTSIPAQSYTADSLTANQFKFSGGSTTQDVFVYLDGEWQINPDYIPETGGGGETYTAGQGIVLVGNEFSVNAGDGLSHIAGGLEVNQAAHYTWTGSHTFDSNAISFPSTHSYGKIQLWGSDNVHTIGTESYHNIYGADTTYTNSVGHIFYRGEGEKIAQIGFGGSGTPSDRLNSRFYGDVSIDGSLSGVSAGHVGAVSSGGGTFGNNFTWTGNHVFSSTGTNRATIEIITPSDNPMDLWLGTNGEQRWSMTARDSSDGNVLSFYSRGNASHNMNISYTTGNVAIGYGTDPTSYKLDVQGSSSVISRFKSTATTSVAKFENTGGYADIGHHTTHGTYMFESNSGNLIRITKSGVLEFRESGSFRGVYHTGNKPSASDVGAVSSGGGSFTGNVFLSQSAIGQDLRSSPRGEFHLHSSGANTPSELFFGYGTTYNGDNASWDISSRGVSDGRLIFFQAPGLTGGGFDAILTLTKAGNAEFTGEISYVDANFTGSDRRWKTDIRDINNGLREVNKLKTYTFLKRGKYRSGFISQEIREHLPHLVKERDDGYLMLHENGIIPYNTRAIQQLDEKKADKTEVERLRDRVYELETEVETLRRAS